MPDAGAPSSSGEFCALKGTEYIPSTVQMTMSSGFMATPACRAMKPALNTLDITCTNMAKAIIQRARRWALFFRQRGEYRKPCTTKAF